MKLICQRPPSFADMLHVTCTCTTTETFRRHTHAHEHTQTQEEAHAYSLKSTHRLICQNTHTDTHWVSL